MFEGRLCYVWQCSSHQRGGQTQDGEERTGRREGGVFADSGLFPHLHVGSSDVISQRLGHHGLPLLTHSDVTSEGELFIIQLCYLSHCLKISVTPQFTGH